MNFIWYVWHITLYDMHANMQVFELLKLKDKYLATNSLTICLKCLLSIHVIELLETIFLYENIVWKVGKKIYTVTYTHCVTLM